MARNHVINLIQSLNSKEQRIVKDYISSIAVLARNSEDSKQMKLIKALSYPSSKELTEIELAKMIGSKNFSSLLYHISEKIYDALLLSKHIQNAEIFDAREQIVFSLKKKILLVKILYRTLNQGKTQAIEHLLHEIIKTANQFEVYDVLIEALITKKLFIGLRVGEKEFNKINAEIARNTKCLQAVNSVTDSFYHLNMNNSLIQSLSTTEVDLYIKKSIKMAEDDLKQCNASEIKYYLLIFKMMQAERKKKYPESIKICSNLIAQLKKNKNIFSKNRMGFALINSCHYHIFLGNYSQAIRSAQEAQKFHITKSFNYLGAKEQEFYAHFYSKNYDMALRITDEMLEHSLADLGHFRKSKFVFYKAYVYFAQENYRNALNLLNKSLEIEKDKTGWNISIRILQILVYVELDKLDEASRSIESIRKYIERNSTDNISKRDILTVRILRELEKGNFKIGSKNSLINNGIKELANGNGKLSWKQFSPELMPFESWIKKRNLEKSHK
jgi:tetratricopeptide (TPR) repeat protein